MSTIGQTSRPFFAEEENRRALEWEANSWVGTPFHAHARKKGVGVDCVQLAAAIYIATGFLREFEPGWYPMDGGSHDATSRVLAWIEKSGKFARVVEPMMGDLVCVRFARVPHHVGIMLSDRQFIHAYFKHHVMVSNLAAKEYRARIDAVYRPVCGSEAAAPLQHLRD